MDLLVLPDGTVRAIYAEDIELTAPPIATITPPGSAVISRASHVEPDSRGRWVADLSPVYGPVLGPFHLRSEALAAELDWLEANWLLRTD